VAEVGVAPAVRRLAAGRGERPDDRDGAIEDAVDEEYEDAGVIGDRGVEEVAVGERVVRARVEDSAPSRPIAGGRVVVAKTRRTNGPVDTLTSTMLAPAFERKRESPKSTVHCGSKPMAAVSPATAQSVASRTLQMTSRTRSRLIQ
jgi:hypothetical protein